jgi:transposase
MRKSENSTIPGSVAMGFRKISDDMKERALHLLTEGWELPAIADVLGVSFKSIDRWADNYDRHGIVPPSYHQGGRRLLSAEAISDLKELIDESPELYLDEIGEWLALYHDIPMSTTALHDNLRDLGLIRKIMRRQAAERDHALRPPPVIELVDKVTTALHSATNSGLSNGTINHVKRKRYHCIFFSILLPIVIHLLPC